MRESVIDKYISPLNRRRVSSFLQNRRATFSLFFLFFVFVVTLFAEVLANDKPLLLSYNNRIGSPLFHNYTDLDLGGDFPTSVDFQDPLIQKNIAKNGWAIWPLIRFSFNTVDYQLDVPTPAAPSCLHWLGTDEEGRDVFVRILYGLRLSLVFAFLLTTISSLIGIFIGAVQGYFGGKIDIFLQRFLEIWESLPQLFVLIIIASLFTPTFLSLLFILILFSWVNLTGVVRAEFLRARNLEFVWAAKALGAGDWRIMFRHILPNAIIATITFVPFLLAEAIVSLTALDFLGFGLPYDYPSLGDLVRQGKDNLQAPWIGLSIFMVLAILLTMLIFIGEGVRDAFDARKNK